MHDPKVMPPAAVVAPSGPAVEGCGFAVRAAAFFIDLIWIGLLSLAIALADGVVLGMLVVIRGGPYSFDQQAMPWFNLASGAIILTLYFTLLEGLYGTTPGKRRLRLYVVQADGTPCRLGAALIRAVLRYVDGILFGLVAYASMHPPLYQRVGDKAAHTLVVPADSPFIRQRRGRSWFIAALTLFLLLSVCSTALLLSVMLL